jgi:hypothetical protein
VRVEDLVGAKVWVKQANGEELTGFISSVPKPVDVESTTSSIAASIFRIDLSSGDVIETSGLNITGMEKGGLTFRKRPK